MDSARKTARLRFSATLALYFAWVAVLGVVAVVSGRRPAPQPSASDTR